MHLPYLGRVRRAETGFLGEEKRAGIPRRRDLSGRGGQELGFRDRGILQKSQDLCGEGELRENALGDSKSKLGIWNGREAQRKTPEVAWRHVEGPFCLRFSPPCLGTSGEVSDQEPKTFLS